jgi:DNA-binding Lrp family transcriptional regulator
MPASTPKRKSSKRVERSNLELIPTPNGLDMIDRQIIGLLQIDGRRAYGAIAEEVGLSEAAVRRRVQRLQDSGVMQIVAITDPQCCSATVAKRLWAFACTATCALVADQGRRHRRGQLRRHDGRQF